MIVKHGEKGRYQCTMCDKSFYIVDEFNKHVMTHTGAKPLKCSKCDKYFAIKHNQRNYEERHEGDTKVNCLKNWHIFVRFLIFEP